MYINILETGAVADGKTVNTASIQAAIDRCAEAGGGRVEIPAGVFVSGSIWLKSHVELYLSQGAVLKASGDLDDYNALDAYPQNYNWPPEEWVGKHLIIAVEQTDIAVSGHGVIDGSGDLFFGEIRPSWGTYAWSYGVSLAKDKEKLRPGQLMVIVECDHVRVTDVTFRNTPCWACFLHGCEYAWIRGICVQNEKHYCNSDGIDIDTCRFVTVSDCIVDTGDDAIAIRCASKRILKDWDTCEHIAISNCVLGSCSSVFRFGVGTGTIRSVNISNINMFRGAVGLNLMTAYLKSGNVSMEDIHFSNITTDKVAFPVKLTEYNNTYIKDITIDGLHAKSMCGISMYADDPGSIHDITFRNVDLELIEPPFPVKENELKERGDAVVSGKNVRDIRFENVNICIPENQKHKWRVNSEFTECENIVVKDSNL